MFIVTKSDRMQMTLIHRAAKLLKEMADASLVMAGAIVGQGNRIDDLEEELDKLHDEIRVVIREELEKESPSNDQANLDAS